MKNFAVLGCGRIGQVHAHSILATPGATLVAVADAMPDAAKSLAATSGAAAIEVADIMADPSIDAVVIGTPTTTHFDLIQAASNAGKAILCEKPVDLSADRIRTCLDTIAANDTPFMVGFNRRFDTNFADAQSRIAAGEIGDVEIVSILSRDPSPPPVSYIETSGGLYRDMMIHDLDMARFLLGEDPVDVMAYGAALVDPAIGAAGDVDTAVAVLRTASGKICQITNSRRATYGYDQRIEVHGSKGMLRAENQLESTVEVATEAGFTRAPAQHFFLERYAPAYRAEIAAFVTCLTDGTAPNPDGLDGLKAQIMADAATHSSQSGQPVGIVF